MKKIEFKCETITPMFLSGADGKTPELRPPSIKGLMRFWWRAIKAEDDIENLRKEEAEIFGSSDEKFGKSKFSLKIVADNYQIIYYQPMPHHTGTNVCPNMPSCQRNRNNRCSKGFKLSALNVKSKFNIVLCTKYEINIDYYANILEISLLLGGWGKRSRRGFGSVCFSNWNFTDRNSLIEYILNKLNSINNDFERNNMEITRRSILTGNYPFIQKIKIGNTTDDHQLLLTKIGQATHDFNDPSLGYAGCYNNTTIRMSSPVYVSCAKVNNSYVPIITILNSAFPNNYPQVNQQRLNSFIGAL